MVEETREEKYGRNCAASVNQIIKLAFCSEGYRQLYRERFVAELEEFSCETRKKGTPANSGCVRELDGVEEVDIKNPEQMARLIKEGIYLMYQKSTAKRVIGSLLENL